jgi:hypothetical protein
MGMGCAFSQHSNVRLLLKPHSATLHGAPFDMPVHQRLDVPALDPFVAPSPLLILTHLQKL